MSRLRVANRILETPGHLYELLLYLFVIDSILRVFIAATIERVGIFYLWLWGILVRELLLHIVFQLIQETVGELLVHFRKLWKDSLKKLSSVLGVVD